MIKNFNNYVYVLTKFVKALSHKKHGWAHGSRYIFFTKNIPLTRILLLAFLFVNATKLVDVNT